VAHQQSDADAGILLLDARIKGRLRGCRDGLVGLGDLLGSYSGEHPGAGEEEHRQDHEQHRRHHEGRRDLVMLNDEEFFQALVDGLPEAFPPVRDQLDYYAGDDGVLLYVVLADARRWIEDNVLVIERPGYTEEMHQQMCEALGRAAYYGSIGDVSARDADLDRIEALGPRSFTAARDGAPRR